MIFNSGQSIMVSEKDFIEILRIQTDSKWEILFGYYALSELIHGVGSVTGVNNLLEKNVI